MKRKILASLVILLLLAGCSRAVPIDFEIADRLCGPNDGVRYIVPDNSLFYGTVKCINGAEFNYSRNSKGVVDE